MQHFVTRAGVEGVITGTCTAMARCLTAPEFDLSGTLSLFIRDEVRLTVVRLAPLFADHRLLCSCSYGTILT